MRKPENKARLDGRSVQTQSVMTFFVSLAGLALHWPTSCWIWTPRMISPFRIERRVCECWERVSGLNGEGEEGLGRCVSLSRP